MKRLIAIMFAIIAVCWLADRADKKEDCEKC